MRGTLRRDNNPWKCGSMYADRDEEPITGEPSRLSPSKRACRSTKSHDSTRTSGPRSERVRAWLFLPFSPSAASGQDCVDARVSGSGRSTVNRGSK